MKSLTRAELRVARVARLPEDHKGRFGHVLIVAGSKGMAGAAILSTRAALRCGAGLVTLAVPEGLQASLRCAVPEAMTLGLPENAAGCLRWEALDGVREALQQKKFTVLAIGPGLSQNPDTAHFILAALSGLELPAVIDADAINILAAQKPEAAGELMRGRKNGSIVTPHPGEMARCLGTRTSEVQKRRQACAEKIARDWNAVVVLKGRRSLISDGKRTVENPSGGPGLAKGGMGDVLTGLIAGLWAQKLAAPFLAAALGAYVHGAAGNEAEKELGPWGMTASDVIARLPHALKNL